MQSTDLTAHNEPAHDTILGANRGAEGQSAAAAGVRPVLLPDRRASHAWVPLLLRRRLRSRARCTARSISASAICPGTSRHERRHPCASRRRIRLPPARAPTRAASAADAAHHDRLRGAQRDCRRAVRLRLVNNESRQLALLRARLEVICETLAQLCMELLAQAASVRQ